MSAFSRLRRCDRGCPVDMNVIVPPPRAPDRWVRVPPVGWWMTSIGPALGETPAALAYQCPECGQTARVVIEAAVGASAA